MSGITSLSMYRPEVPESRYAVCHNTRRVKYYMNIIQRFRNILSGLSDPRKKSVISRRFVIALSVIYSSLILSVAISFYIIMHLNAATLKETLESNSRDIMLERTELIVSRVQSAGNPTITGITNELRAYNRNTGKLVAAFIFTKTSDENYFRLAESLLFHDDFRPGWNALR